MLRGGVASHGLLLGALLATPACGFIVGFEARDLCSDCPGDGGAAGSDAGGSLGTDSSLGGSDVNGASTGGATSGAQTSPSSGSSSEGGSGGSSLSDGDSTTGAGGSETVGGAGGADAVGGTGGVSDGGMGGGTETVSGTGTGTGGTNTGSTSAGGTSTGGTSAGGTSTGGASSGGDGGIGGGTDDTSTTTTTTSVGGSAGVGGSGGSGGTGGAPSPCEVETPFDASATDGIYPADLMLGRANIERPWALTWVDSDDVYFASYDDDGYAEFPPAVIDGSGTHSASVVTTQGQYAYVAYGELAAGEARIVMNVLNPLSPGVPEQTTTAILDSDDAPPDVLGIALKGATSDTLVAAIDADEAGVLAWFSDGAYDMVVPVPGPLAALAPLDLGESFAVAFVQDDTLQVSLVSYESMDIEVPQDISDSVQTNSERPVAGVSLANGAALVWVESDGIYLTTLDESGDPEPKVRVSYGSNHVLPMVAAVGSQLMVSWINAETDTLYMRRFPTGLSGSAEAPKAVMTQVAETRYGFAADTFTATKASFGFVFAVERLKVALVTCPI